jgi:CRP/FNR family cyclic AMP-dependent transcriptional regulator
VNRTKEEILQQVDLFANLQPDYLKLLAGSFVRRAYEAGTVIVEQGAEGIGLMVIVAGNVQVLKKPASGEDFKIATMGPNEFFGELTVLDNAPRSASVVAMESTECLVLSSWAFKAAMETHPQIALQVLPVVVSRYRETNAKLMELQERSIA